MKRGAFLGIIVLSFLAHPAWAQDPVYFADANLKAAVEAELSIADPTPADMLGLTTLSATGAGITSLTGLEEATNLAELFVWDNAISNVSPLSGLGSLTDLHLGDNQISDISALSGLTNLSRLRLQNNTIGNISALAGLPDLRYLNLWGNQVSDLSPLSGLTTLITLDLYGNDISDIASLSGLTNLHDLNLGTNYISNISALSGLGNLTQLRLYHNQLISDLSPLSGLTGLTLLYLTENQISDISPLSGLTGLTSLGLANNEISSVSALSGLAELGTLYLGSNQISDIAALAGLMNLTSVDLKYNSLNNAAYCTYIPAILANNPTLVPGSTLNYSANDNPPSNVSASDGTYSDKVTVTWDSVCGVAYDSRYMVYRSESSEGAKTILTDWQLATYFDDTTASPEVVYYYWVKAESASSSGIYQHTDYSLSDTGWCGPGATTYSLNTSSTAGGSVTVPGEGSYAYTAGTDVSIVATAQTDYEFAGWSGTAVSAGQVVDAGAASTTVTVDADYTLVASFTPVAPSSYTLSVSSGAGGSVTAPGEGTFTCEPGATVSVQAVAANDYNFTGWTGTAVGAGQVANPGAASTTVTVDANYTLTANFLAKDRTLSVSSTPGGWVTTPGEGSFTYSHGQTVTLQAKAAAGYHFVEWSGSQSSSKNPLSFTMNADHHVTANFALNPPTLTVSSGQGGRVLVPGEGTFVHEHGDAVRAVALPDAGYVFAGWTGTVVETGGLADPSVARVDFTVEMDAGLCANFAPAVRCLYVDDDAPGDPAPRDPFVGDPAEDGTWNHPFDSIQEAIDVATDGDAVLVLSGRYWENIALPGRGVMVSAFDLGDCGAVSQTLIIGTDADSVVAFEESKGAGSILAGFTIQGGDAKLGGGIRCCGADPIIANCLIAGNRADFGGGVYLQDSRATLANCTVADNVSRIEGGGVYCLSDAMVIDSILCYNQPQQMVVDPGQAPSVTYSAVRGGWPGEGNIDADPRFATRGSWSSPAGASVDAADPEATWGSGDYHLRARAGRWVGWMWLCDGVTSPCVDAGNPKADPRYEPRPHGGRINMGAFGGTAEASQSDLDE